MIYSVVLETPGGVEADSLEEAQERAKVLAQCLGIEGGKEFDDLPYGASYRLYLSVRSVGLEEQEDGRLH